MFFVPVLNWSFCSDSSGTPHYALEPYQDACKPELIPRVLHASLKTMQTHVNEVTAIHALVNAPQFQVVISKHGTGLVAHRGQLKKGLG